MIDFKPGNVVDGDDATYWTTDDGTKSGSLTIKWNTAKKFDVVSIEEAIQKGQHINSYTVEYKTSDSANWQTLKTGVTIGAKRLIRTSPVSATQVRITVGTSDGKVPMLSEVGVYKASEGFQLAGSAPEGMETTSVNDTTKLHSVLQDGIRRQEADISTVRIHGQIKQMQNLLLNSTEQKHI